MVLLTEPRSTIILYLIDNFERTPKLSFSFYWMSEGICNVKKNKVRSCVAAIVTMYHAWIDITKLCTSVEFVDGGNRFKRFKMAAIFDQYVLNVSF